MLKRTITFARSLACCIAVVMGLSTATFTTAIADTVSVPVGQQGHYTQIDKPGTGMTKAQVERKFGEPQAWRDPVGDPPISSWVYNNFTVYFEYDHVIHSVSTPKVVN